MPCRDWEGIDNQRERIIYQDNPSTKKKLDEVTNMLCYVMTYLSQNNTQICNDVQTRSNFRSKNLREWWKKHQEEDRQREAYEKKVKLQKLKLEESNKQKELLKKKAISKLTIQERKALNL